MDMESHRAKSGRDIITLVANDLSQYDQSEFDSA
jgi:hypothetical protein